MDSRQKVNKISVDIDEDDFTTVSLYKTNNLLGVIECENLGGVPSFSQSGISRKAYQLYIRDIIINLLDNGGIEGFYYEEKQETESVKYDNNGFLQKAKEYVENLTHGICEFVLSQDLNMETERYKNSYIKNATARFPMLIKYNNRVIKCKLVCNIKSGQMCRPKTILCGDEYNTEFPFNITSFKKIIKQYE